MHVSNPSVISQSLGGVGYNVSRAVQLTGSSVQLCSMVGEDLSGQICLNELASQDMPTSGIRVRRKTSGKRTAQYVAVNDAEKSLVLAMADMSILEGCDSDTSSWWTSHVSSKRPKWLVVDANWDTNAIHGWIRAGKEANASIVFEPVSAPKATRLITHLKGNPFEPGSKVFPDHQIDLITPNPFELAALHSAGRSAGIFDREDWWGVINELGLPATGSRAALTALTSAELVDAGIPQQSIQLLPFVPAVTAKLGERGVLLTMLLRTGDPRLAGSHEAAPWILARAANADSESQVGGVYMRLLPPPEVLGPGDFFSVNGAGDTFVGALVSGLARTGKGIEELVQFAQRAAIMTLKSGDAVSPEVGTLKNLL